MWLAALLGIEAWRAVDAHPCNPPPLCLIRVVHQAMVAEHLRGQFRRQVLQRHTIRGICPENLRRRVEQWRRRCHCRHLEWRIHSNVIHSGWPQPSVQGQESTFLPAQTGSLGDSKAIVEINGTLQYAWVVVGGELNMRHLGGKDAPFYRTRLGDPGRTKTPNALARRSACGCRVAWGQSIWIAHP
jgi:hypothetical protein